MFKEALEYIVKSQQEKVITSGKHRYTDVSLRHLDEEVRAEHIEMSTLSSLVDYIKSNTDKMADKMLIQVVSPTQVKLISMLDSDRKREYLVVVNADIPSFSFDRFMNSEEFLIGLRSKFIQNEDAEKLLRFTGTVENGTVATYGDDGISQSATVKQGIIGKGDELVPNPVKLRPYRTFIEVEQPESEFIFRMKNNEMRVSCAIFEADGGVWKREAMKNIKSHLEFELADLSQFTVIS